MDKAVENAIKRKSELTKELEEIELFLKLHEKFAVGMNAEQTVSPQPVKDRDSSIARKRGRPDDFADLMELVLKEVRRPLNRPDFVDELERRGYEIPSEDKPRYLGTILWRHRKRFRNLPKFGYWLIDEPYEPAGYDPATDTEASRLLDVEVDIVERPYAEGGEE